MTLYPLSFLVIYICLSLLKKVPFISIFTRPIPVACITYEKKLFNMEQYCKISFVSVRCKKISSSHKKISGWIRLHLIVLFNQLFRTPFDKTNNRLINAEVTQPLNFIYTNIPKFKDQQTISNTIKGHLGNISGVKR